MVENLYVHFPFCRRKCSYCALHSRAGASQAVRDAYVRRLVERLETEDLRHAAWNTVYFGGGSPALCDLRPLLEALDSRSASAEFTVELHPLDVTADLLETLRAGGVNRISMGVQALDDATLADMGRGYAVDEAERAFRLVRERFDNAGIDLIVGYPSPRGAGWTEAALARLETWGLRHCSVYSLILEENSILNHRLKKGLIPASALPSDDETLDRLSAVARFLKGLGLERYEISNYAVPGYECRHNLAVWRGEDYLGLGEGAHGRIGLVRTTSGEVETVSPEFDEKERTLFRLRMREGLDLAEIRSRPSRLPLASLVAVLDRFVREGLLVQSGECYRLTERGTEVCDAILAELV